MGYDFSSEETPGMLVVRIGGRRPLHDSDNLEQLWDFWAKSAERCRSVGIDRLLIVSSADGSITSSAAVSFYSRLDQIGFDRCMQIAVVVAEDRARRVIELGVAIAKERGWHITVVGTEADARAWLGAGRRPAGGSSGDGGYRPPCAR